jgi:molecular chaperone HtpG
MAKKKTKKFGTETAKILQLVIHSLYTNKDIFLRELVSNASDACDKLRFSAQQNSELLGTDSDLKITLQIDEKARTITIADNGIGMDEAELVDNLGTIAKSGTAAFAEANEKADVSLIGQFGVGFYSAFMVADLVEVFTRKAGTEEGFKWESAGEGEYTIEAANDVSRGTRIVLHLRDNANEYLKKFKLQHIVKTYSDHISIPVIYVAEDGKEEQFNSGTAIWVRPKNKITDEQYQEFYKAVSHQVDTPFMRLHGKAEGVIEYSYLLFVPTMKPFDLFHPDRMRRVKLYVKRVFIAEENIDVIPRYLRFIRGIIDSEDLPLNVSRETLQANPIIEKIRAAITKKILGEFKKKAEKEPEEYEKFWNNFGAVIKEGLCEGLENREQILEVCCFNSTKSDKLIALDEYLERMKPEQKEIYYLSGEHLDAMRNSPQIEGFEKRGIEVLLFNDSVDDFWVQVGHEYKGKQFKSVTRADIELEETEEEKAEEKNDYATLLELFRTELGDKVKDVRVSKKLDSSPVCLAVAAGDLDMRMERFLHDQKQIPEGSPMTAKILEINPHHKLIESINSKGDTPEVRDLINLLFDQAMIAEGENVSDIKAFSQRLSHFLEKALVA